ncbi:hypothetical protein U1Q18_016340 [Sarracenia purpurea var. burkii]
MGSPRRRVLRKTAAVTGGMVSYRQRRRHAESLVARALIGAKGFDIEGGEFQDPVADRNSMGENKIWRHQRRSCREVVIVGNRKNEEDGSSDDYGY